ncbi:cupin domain-containing protein [Longimicrobium sp.]|uniref:cupin domain-containing protein n=1 Tax=Longimicrobium sp. TaxID=2029185 RepID=UPI002E2FB0DB|nr:cupin domain-containing protein [Longimicrobium sp.]HEX6038654.1 cupin domain-containing protein [Longimicrobium sp.]
MHRANQLIRDLHLQPHPEGGYYREIHRSTLGVHPDDRRPARSALTVIYFLLDASGHSRWHRVTSDEVWQHVEGAELELFRIDPELREMERMRLGALGGGAEPVRVIPPGHWQAARTTGSYTLVACSVGPGFDFADFAMLADHPREADLVRRHFPDAAPLV